MGSHDRGRVASDLACAIADGPRMISDFRVMGDQRELFGHVASVPTVWRVLKEIAEGGRRALATSEHPEQPGARETPGHPARQPSHRHNHTLKSETRNGPNTVQPQAPTPMKDQVEGGLTERCHKTNPSRSYIMPIRGLAQSTERDV